MKCQDCGSKKNVLLICRDCYQNFVTQLLRERDPVLAELVRERDEAIERNNQLIREFYEKNRMR